jgi:hypothetical protein
VIIFGRLVDGGVGEGLALGTCAPVKVWLGEGE